MTRHTTSKCFVTLGVTLLLAALAPAPGAFAASAYTITDFGAGSEAYDINESGQVVGRNGPIATFGSNAFLYSNGTMLDLGARGGNFGSTAYGLNNLGQVVGFYYDPTDDDNSHPFFYDGTTMHDISGSPSFGEANGINDNGQIVGGIDFDFSAGPSPFLYNANTSTMDILPGIPPAVSNAPVINQHGLNVVNQYDAPVDKSRATLFDGLTEIRELGFIPGGGAFIQDINN